MNFDVIFTHILYRIYFSRYFHKLLLVVLYLCYEDDDNGRDESICIALSMLKSGINKNN